MKIFAIFVVVGIVALIGASILGWNSADHKHNRFHAVLDDKEVVVNFDPNPLVPELGGADTSKPVYRIIRAEERRRLVANLPRAMLNPERVVWDSLNAVVRVTSFSPTYVLRRELQAVLGRLGVEGEVWVSPSTLVPAGQ